MCANLYKFYLFHFIVGCEIHWRMGGYFSGGGFKKYKIYVMKYISLKFFESEVIIKCEE